MLSAFQVKFSLTTIFNRDIFRFILGAFVLLFVIYKFYLYFTNVKPNTNKVQAFMDEREAKYIINKTEGVCSVAHKFYKTCNYKNLYGIVTRNQLVGDSIPKGRTIYIPNLDKEIPVSEGEISSIATRKVQSQATEYIVKEGDTLCSIAEAMYGDCNAWTMISNANNLGADARIENNQKLIIPRD